MFNSFAFTQSVKIDTLKLELENDMGFEVEKMNFPIIKSNHPKIDSIINNDIKNRFTYNEYPTLPTQIALDKWSDGQLVYIEFGVTYNQNNILSINISSEGCGAYCSSRTEYYNYSTKTGDFLTIYDVMDTSTQIIDTISHDKNKQFQSQKNELNNLLIKKELDRDTYDFAIENFEDCENSFNYETFYISEKGLTIIYDCYFPHVIQSLAPIIVLKYDFSVMKNLTQK